MIHINGTDRERPAPEMQRTPLPTRNNPDPNQVGSMDSENHILDLSRLHHLDPVFKIPLLCCRALCTCSTSSKWAGQGSILNFDDTDTRGSSDIAITGHARRHLDTDGEVCGCGTRKTAHTYAGDVDAHLGRNEGRRIGATRGGINGGCERTCTVLVY